MHTTHDKHTTHKHTNIGTVAYASPTAFPVVVDVAVGAVERQAPPLKATLANRVIAGAFDPGHALRGGADGPACLLGPSHTKWLSGWRP